MNVKVNITLTDDDHNEEGEEMQVQIEETIPGKVLSRYKHKDEHCQTSRAWLL